MPVYVHFSLITSKREAQEVYIALVQQSRNPFFYIDCAVPDTLDGRFDIILLHIFLKLHFLKANGGQDTLSRLLLESLFDDMDRSLREMGVGDMGVSKRVKTMSKAVFGRLEAYTKAYSDDAMMREALIRNVYRGTKVTQEACIKLLNYTRTYQADGVL